MEFAQGETLSFGFINDRNAMAAHSSDIYSFIYLYLYNVQYIQVYAQSNDT